ncbi:phosphatidylinositol-specific phospholipase C/glycerophosphodiester phosphodiesterase family protein [Rhodocytophaga aerolata]|uniref:Altered inheritance of mitochondria protein 6 n=1 Tax=Rhodocytophaga aerolata TaxID=455078 RepID=A0ABT8R6M7_9BACT|nr:phosphatidylinositol-specific phospholipase C/glycerophosphodiester phosphodiesterase family protein [Rhodocytophaga aerolata]MDO1447604.1 phosphatidylinositol-specific phospholipase C/glycerophosphodiester phosphodiesterase family protein [Rhodocytophaga aerolata]
MNTYRFSFFVSSLLLLSISLFSYTVRAQVHPLLKAHAHNDYMHAKPLFDALTYGFTSIEADIHLIDNELYVVHDKPESTKGLPTLKALYLEPLAKHIKQNNGFVYKGHTSPVYLMIDIKTDGTATYAVLKKQLALYKEILYSPANPKGQVQVVLSGNRPIDSVKSESAAQVSIDGRPEDLPANYPVQFMPVISQNYFKILAWTGEGNISQEDKQKLEQLVKAVHAQGKKLRLWASPEKETVWQVLLETGVDFINTDKLPALQAFMQKATTK